MYKIPTFISEIINLSLKGITAHADNAKVIVTIGASMKTTLLALAGIIISLNTYFNASASVWNNPKGPTTFGPFLFGQSPRLFCQTKLSLQLKLKQVLTIIKF